MYQKCIFLCKLFVYVTNSGGGVKEKERCLQGISGRGRPNFTSQEHTLHKGFKLLREGLRKRMYGIFYEREGGLPIRQDN